MMLPPIKYECKDELLGKLKAPSKPINLVLIGHGCQGTIKVGEYPENDLNLLSLPKTITSNVKRVFLLHCGSGLGVGDIGRNTISNNPDSWEKLKTISGNVFYINWDNISHSILQRGWSDAPTEVMKDEWKKRAIRLIEAEKDPERLVDDFWLKYSHPYLPGTILTPEGYHNTYYVEENKVSLSYPKSKVRPGSSMSASATASRQGRSDVPVRSRSALPLRSRSAGRTSGSLRSFQEDF